MSNEFYFLSFLGLVSEQTRQMATPGEIGESTPGPITFLSATASHGLQRWRDAHGSMAVTAIAISVAWSVL